MNPITYVCIIYKTTKVFYVLAGSQKATIIEFTAECRYVRPGQHHSHVPLHRFAMACCHVRTYLGNWQRPCSGQVLWELPDHNKNNTYVLSLIALNLDWFRKQNHFINAGNLTLLFPELRVPRWFSQFLSPQREDTETLTACKSPTSHLRTYR